MIRYLALTLCAVSVAAAAYFFLGNEVPASTTIDHTSLRTAGPSSEIVVSGRNDLPEAATIVLRVDDYGSTDYWTRANVERKVPPGAFKFRIPLADLKTPRGRKIELETVKLVLLFPSPKSSDVVIESATVEEGAAAAKLGEDVVAIDFGEDGGPVFPGFTGHSQASPVLKGRSLRARKRPGGDALVSDGVEGVETISLDVTPGAWLIQLWTKDLGEWEYLPHALERRIRINGATAMARHQTPDRWVSETYLAGRAREWRPGLSAWDMFGSRRGGEISYVVNAPNGRIEIEFAGSDRSASFVSGLIAVPQEQFHLLGQLQAARQIRFNETWRHAAPEFAPPPARVTVEAATGAEKRAAPGTIAIFEVEARAPEPVERPEPEIADFELNGARLSSSLFAGHWRLTRPETSTTLLHASDRHLRGDAAELPLTPALPRRYVIVVRVPQDAAPGRYDGSFTVAGESIPLGLDVLDVPLPEPRQAIGLYHEDLPYYGWFKQSPQEARVCDFTLLKSLGLTTVAPPLTTPENPEKMQLMNRDISLARLAGFNGPLMGYTPLKRLQRHADWANRLDAAYRSLGAESDRLLWSAADEVSNSGEDLDAVAKDIEAVRTVAPGIRLAGHLNAARDQQIAGLFDLVLINSGYGLVPETLRALKEQGVETYLYNQGHARLAAGAYLWRQDLDGYLQWHARMPTADPFDPTDGREADVQWLYPTASACPRTPDIDRSLLDMAEGVVDLRWLLWLDEEALRNAKAFAVRESLRDQMSGSWNQDKSLTKKQLTSFRQQIEELAQNLR